MQSGIIPLLWEKIPREWVASLRARGRCPLEPPPAFLKKRGKNKAPTPRFSAGRDYFVAAALPNSALLLHTHNRKLEKLRRVPNLVANLLVGIIRGLRGLQPLGFVGFASETGVWGRVSPIKQNPPPPRAKKKPTGFWGLAPIGECRGARSAPLRIK